MTATFDREAISRARTIMTTLSEAHGYQWIGHDVSEFIRFHDALVEALEPFARAGELFGDLPAGVWEESVYMPAAGMKYSIGGNDLRRARSLLSTLKEEGE